MWPCSLTEEARGVTSSCHQHPQRQYLRQEHLPTPLLLIVFLLFFHPSALVLDPPSPVHLPSSHLLPLLHLLSSTQAHFPLPRPTFLPLPPSLHQNPDFLHPSHPGTHCPPPRLPVTANGYQICVPLLSGATCTSTGPVNQVWTF